MTLYEGGYNHKFELVFDEEFNVERILQVRVSNSSTATANYDFKLLTESINVAANSLSANIEIQVLDDDGLEGKETIELEFIAENGSTQEYSISIDDRSFEPKSLPNLSGIFFNPVATVIGDLLFVADHNTIERYNLRLNQTTAVSTFSPAIDLAYADAVSYKEKRFVFVERKLYAINEDELKYELISESPIYLDWTSELQVIGDVLYVFGGRDSEGNSTQEVLAYEFITDTWLQKQNLIDSFYGAASAVVDGKIYVFDRVSSQVYDPEADLWTLISNESTLGSFFDSAVASGDYIFITDSKRVETSTVFKYDVKTDTYTEYVLNMDSQNYQDTILYKGKIYVIGNTFDSSIDVKDISIYYIGDD